MRADFFLTINVIFVNFFSVTILVILQLYFKIKDISVGISADIFLSLKGWIDVTFLLAS